MISVVIPCFNTDAILFEECIKSVTQQTYTDIEILVIDDGSEKKNLDKLKKIIESYSNDKMKFEEHMWLAAARNLGISNSHGEYITFIDSDDIIAPDMIENLYSVAVKETATIVLGYIDSFDYGQKYDFHGGTDLYNELNHDEQEKLALVGFSMKKTGLGFLSCGPCAALYKKELVEKILFPAELEIFEDIYWNILVFRASKKTIMINKTVYAYRQVEGSITHTWKLSTINKRIKALKEIEKIVVQNNYKNSLEWYAVRLLNNYTTIISVVMKTKELSGRRERFQYAKQQAENKIWNTLNIPEISKNWPAKNKIKLILYRLKLIIPVYYLKYSRD